MKRLILTCPLYLAIALPGWAIQADAAQDAHPHAQPDGLPGHGVIGKPDDGTAITRTIEVTIKETASGYMLCEPDAIHIGHDPVVRFVIRNLDVLVLGSFNEVNKHQQWMRKHPDMQHPDANAVSIRSGKTADLIWKFSDITSLEFVCLMPDHREAGMWGVIMVHDHIAPRAANQRSGRGWPLFDHARISQDLTLKLQLKDILGRKTPTCSPSNVKLF